MGDYFIAFSFIHYLSYPCDLCPMTSHKV